ncbi:PhzF family phenazine biosynthesis protein [Streptomyces sp. NRRL WC-3742]|uniref:PhzF family phenazine biosynthesis protein n=1 Tax=Streptomyces sp. NRRL WC-3742 TaxID=1463934 RepID=UPI00068F870E|nr:PhzF family phenazine biosynthesis protein [Streptomyces sp. NRRL WC-3742]
MIGYRIVDMFTDRPFGGSPLGVVPHAQGLSTASMQAIAAELNTAETAFVLPPTDPDCAYRVRVFSPAAESPHGSHCAVGTAATLVRLGIVPAGPLLQECGTGRQQLAAEPGRATLTAAGAVRGADLDPKALLALTGLDEADLEGPDGLTPRSAGFGAGFAFLPVRPPALDRARPDLPGMAGAGLPALCLFTWDDAERTAHARLFAPGFGIPEDPACGPVAMALGALLAEAGRLPATDGTHAYTVHQGARLGRPATLACTVSLEGGRVVRGGTTGQVTPVASGRIATAG